MLPAQQAAGQQAQQALHDILLLLGAESSSADAVLAVGGSCAANAAPSGLAGSPPLQPGSHIGRLASVSSERESQQGFEPPAPAPGGAACHFAQGTSLHAGAAAGPVPACPTSGAANHAAHGSIGSACSPRPAWLSEEGEPANPLAAMYARSVREREAAEKR